MEWVDGNIGSKLTMKYPAVILKGEGARGMTLSIALAGKGQHQDAGAKMIHLAPNTSSTIVSKSISKQGGKVTYRGIVHFGRKRTAPVQTSSVIRSLWITNQLLIQSLTMKS